MNKTTEQSLSVFQRHGVEIYAVGAVVLLVLSWVLVGRAPLEFSMATLVPWGAMVAAAVLAGAAVTASTVRQARKEK